MVIGILQFELSIPWATSLKDKRRVVRSIKDRLHREHMVSIAETGMQESHTVAVMGLAMAASDGRAAARTLDLVSEKLRAWPDAELVSSRREVLRSADVMDDEDAGDDRPGSDLAAEMLGRGLGAADDENGEGR